MTTKNITAKTFFSKFDKITPFEFIAELLPKCTSDGPWIAGGSLHRTFRNIPLNNADIDVFFKNEEQKTKFLEDLIKNKSGKYESKDLIVSQWHDCVTITCMGKDWKIQCVKFVYFQNITELFKSFDINVCRLAYDGNNVIYEDNIFDDIKTNKLKLNDEAINYPSVTLKRLIKYVKMGYDVDDTELKKLCYSFNKKKKIVLDMDLATKKPSSDDYENVGTGTATASLNKFVPLAPIP